MKIFSVYYGLKSVLFRDDLITPIQAGAYYKLNDEILLSDDFLAGLSDKNNIYNELTALYSIWKKYSVDQDYIGLCHYRRYFIYNKKRSVILKFINKLPATKLFDFYKFDALSKTSEFLNNNIHNYDAIFPKKIKVPFCENIEAHYNYFHNKEFYVLMKEIIFEYFQYLSPSVYPSSSTRNGYFFNMFILKRELFNQYCESLFEFTGIFEKLAHSRWGDLPERSVGFIAERFSNIYFNYLVSTGIHYLELDVVMIKGDEL